VAVCGQDHEVTARTRACRVAVLVVAATSALLWPAASWAAPAQDRPALAREGGAPAQDRPALAREGVARVDPLIPGPNGEMPDGWVQTQWGALGPVDVALVEGVRRANLWEGPAGQMAVAKGGSPRVREIGATISGQHVKELDPLTLKVGEQLNIPLPNQPSDEQLGWLAEMQQRSGTEFDLVFVHRLRVAHAKVFALIATVRANTRNSIMRTFAQTANKYVDGHLSLLDSTNLVEFNALPTPVLVPPTRSILNEGIHTPVLYAILIIAAVAGAAGAVRIIRPR
jgi:hypothetical protein